MGGGGKKGGEQTVGYKYYVGMHMVFCQGPVDYFLRLTVGEDNRVAWEGKASGGQIKVDKPKLFGGDDREGGVKGTFDILMGYPDQQKNDYLLAQIGSNIPAYRGVFSIVARQVYWGNNPYLKPARARLQRIYVRQDGIEQWYPGKAGIPYGDIDEYPTEVHTEPTPFELQMFVSQHEPYGITFLENGSGTIWDLQAREAYATTPSLGAINTEVYTFDSTNHLYALGATISGLELFKLTIDGTIVSADIIDPNFTLIGSTLRALERSPGSVDIYAGLANVTLTGYIHKAPLGPPALVAHTLSGRDFAISAQGQIVGVFQPDGASSDFSLIEMDEFGAPGTQHDYVGLSGRGDITYAQICHVESAGHWFVWMDGNFYLIDDVTFAVKSSGAMADQLRLQAEDPSNTTVWFGFREYSLVTGALIRQLNHVLWGALGSGPEQVYDKWGHGIWQRISGLTGPFVSYMFDKGAYDMNPAHMIRECLTDPDWGMGYLDDDVDDAAFEQAADILHAERMGMSMLWDKQATLEAFIGDVVRHIDGALYVSRSTGKFRLKLTRADYDPDTLILLDESNIESISDPSRPQFGELVNSVSVKFWQRNNGKPDTVTVQDPAGVQMQGAVLNTTIQYDGFTNLDVAGRVADRDLRALSNPFLTCTIITGEVAADLDIGDVFKLQYPKWQIHEPIVMRITGFGMSDGRDNKVRIQCVEDVFSTPMNSVVAPPAEEWVDPAGPPDPAAASVAFEVPYYEMVQVLGQATTDSNIAANPELGHVGAAAMRGNDAAINAHLWVDDAGDGFEDAGAMDLAPGGFLVDALNRTDTLLTLENFEDLDLVEIGSHAQIGDGEFHELVRIDGINASTGVVSVGRGVLDTVPQLHLAGAKVLFWDNHAGADLTEYVSGETIDVKVQPHSGQGVVSLAQCPTHEVTLIGRAYLPYPPGDLRINGLSYSDAPQEEILSITWTHRDRLQQTSGELADHFDGSIGPEDGTLYRVQGYINDALVHVEDDIAGTGTVWFPGGEGLIMIEVHAKRDGVYSMQAATHEFFYTGIVDARVTENEDLRYTEDGDQLESLRVTEA